MEYDVIVIGAGIGGLTSAVKLSLAGRRVLVLEKQPVPGGFATSFTRRGFVFESSLHCVDALGPEGDVRLFLEEIGIDKKIEFIPLKDFSRIIYPEHDFVADFNPDNYINFLKESFPQEAEGISRLFRKFNRFYKQFDGFAYTKLPTGLKLAISPFVYPDVIRMSCLTIEQFIGRYIRDARLKAIITDVWRFMGLPPSRLSALYFLLVFRGYYYNPTVYIKGGFTRLFRAMVERIKEAGSEVRFNTKVEKILTSTSCHKFLQQTLGTVPSDQYYQRFKSRGTSSPKGLKSVITDKGEEFKARAIISNANAIDTLTVLPDSDSFKSVYSRKVSGLEKSISAFQVYLGLGVPAKALGMDHFMFSLNTTYDHGTNFNCSIGIYYDRCPFSLVDHAQVDPTLVPEGKGSLLIMVLDTYSNWRNLTEEEYKKKKMEVANKLVARAEKYLPGLTRYIEVMEAATPRTMSRFSLSPEGAIYGFAQTVGQSGINRLSNQTEIKGLFLAGAWTWPGAGAHACFVSGVEAAELALKFLK